MRHNTGNIIVNAIRSLRKQLSFLARKGVYGLRLIGSRGKWFIGVERGESIVIVSPQFSTKGEAAGWNIRKHQKAFPTRSLALPVAA